MTCLPPELELDVQIRQGRSRFLAMAGSYALGVFNDNFIKQGVSLMAIAAGVSYLQGYIAIVFTLPFLLFAALAGWMADRFPRRYVVIGSKAMELLVMLAASYGLLHGHWYWLLGIIFAMAAQATIFSPSLNGAIPDLFPASYVLQANSRLKSVTTGCILLGVVGAGLALGRTGSWGPYPLGRCIIALGAVLVSLVGLILSFGVPYRRASNPRAPFPLLGPWGTILDLWELRSDPLLFACIGADTFVWFAAAVQLLVINKMGLKQFGLNETTTSYLALAEFLGVAIGGLVAGKIVGGPRWHRILAPSALVMALFLAAASAGPFLPRHLQLWYVLAMLAGCGVGGGLLLVPLESFFQIRPEPSRRGAVIAAANFASFVGICLGGLLYAPMDRLFQPSQTFAILGLLTFAAALVMAKVFGRFSPPDSRSWTNRFLAAVGRGLLSLRYRVQIEGLDSVAQAGRSGLLILPNHPSLMDPVILTTYFYKRFAVRAMAVEHRIQGALIGKLTRQFHVLPIPDLAELGEGNVQRTQEAMARCVAALRSGDNLLLYPAGRLMRGRFESLGGASAVERILAELPDVRVVLVRTTGLWGSVFSWAWGASPHLDLPGAARKLLAGGIFILPRRPVRVLITEPQDFPRDGTRLEINRYLEKFYNLDAPPATYVPLKAWEKGGVRILPERQHSAPSVSPAQGVPAATRRIVFEQLSKLTGMSDFSDTQRLAGDLGLDSLAVTDLVLWIQREFGMAVTHVEAIESVGDLLAAACGELASAKAVMEIPPPDPRWELSDALSDASPRAAVPPGETVNAVFLAQARLNPHRLIVADLTSGGRTYRDIITGILALRGAIAALPGSRVGLLLPASVAMDTLYMACLFAGKTPVMINWTVGTRNLRHGLELAGVRHILTSRTLMSRLKSQGIDLSDFQESLVMLEDLREKMSRWTKLSAVIQARLSWRALDRVEAPATAAILFTSGSEALPKAVPLTHGNFLANIRDGVEAIEFYRNSRFLGMLPPFHSFGLTGTLLLPLLTGARVVHYPNPNDAATVARLVEVYGVTILVGTPTFVGNIVQSAQPQQLRSVKLFVTGAEKCPLRLYETLARLYPASTTLEGYGITECSPVVALNRLEDPRPGTIGRPLPSVQWVIMDETTGQACRAGESGMLLVRGPSIFGGYLNSGIDPFVRWNEQLWYRTGDLVQADASGHLTFVGRLKRFVKLGGEMISLPAIEEVLEKAFPTPPEKSPGLAVLATSDDEHPELVLFTTQKLERTQVNQAIRQAGLSPLYNIRLVKIVDTLPVLGSGKTDYRSLKEWLGG